jgi:hypothetical protein
MAEMLLSDPELRNAAAVMGEHYPYASEGNSTAFELGKFHIVATVFDIKRHSSLELRR